MQIKRIFPSVLSVAENIGGVAEMLVFMFVLMMLQHHDIIMELFLLNNAVLQIDAASELEKPKKNQISDRKSIP